jgi:hypothetical protein
MLAELVLVTRLLGLVSGEYPVSIYVDPRVARVELLRNGVPVRTVAGPPWQALLDFGSELVPQELTAVAYDASGVEIARDTQLVNLPRPSAEAAIDLRREGETLRATVRWQHIGSERVRDIAWKLDGKGFGKGEASLLLPRVEPRNLHVVEVEVQFWDGVVARRERVFGGLFTEEVPTELTGAVVHVGEGSSDPANCFRVDGRPVAAVGVEKGEAMVVFVRDPDPRAARKALRAKSGKTNLDADIRIMWPTATAIVEKDRRTVSNLFEHSQVIEGTKMGTQALLTGRGGPKKNEQRYADAVAVSGVYAALGARRRAVVLVVGANPDKSRQSPAVVRRYLERIGVPFRVWSLAGAKKEVTGVWGEVVDISSAAKLLRATEELQQELERQRVAWLPLEPLDALRVEAAAGCGLVPVARP